MQQAQLISPQNLSRITLGALVVAVVAIVFSIIGAAVDIDLFFQVYLVAYLFCLQIALGCLGFLLLLNVVDGRWGVPVRRIAAAGARTIPVLAVLFIPLLLGLNRVFSWADADAALSGNKAIYYNVGWFIFRAIVYFAVWIGLAFVLSSWSYRYDKEGDPELKTRSYYLSLIGGLLFFVTTTFAAFDWMMSLDKDFFSSIFGWLSNGQQGLSAMAFFFVVLSFLWNSKPISEAIDNRVMADLSTLLLVAVMVWAYFHVIQFIVIWSGDLPKKAIWFVERTEGGWGGYASFMALAHAILIFLLLVPGIKTMRVMMAVIASLLLGLRLIEMYWMIVPSNEAEVTFGWWIFALPLAIGGLCLAFFTWTYEQYPLVPVENPGVADGPTEEESYETA